MKLKHYLSVFAIAALAASCAKEGPAGPQGDPGLDGVANIYTEQYSVTTGGWTNSAVDTWTATFSEPDITNNNYDAVEAYWSNAATGWIAMPFSNINVNGDQLSYGFDDGSITFAYYGNPNPPDSYLNTTTIYFKVTVIPPSIQAKYPNINWKNATEALTVPEVQAALRSTKK